MITNKKNEEFWKAELKNLCGYVPVSHISKVELPADETVLFFSNKQKTKNKKQKTKNKKQKTNKQTNKKQKQKQKTNKTK